MRFMQKWDPQPVLMITGTGGRIIARNKSKISPICIVKCGLKLTISKKLVF